MSKPLRVLLVEDSEHEAVLVLRALRKGGYDPEAMRVDTGAAMADALDKRDFDVIVGGHELRHFSAHKALAVRDARRPGLPFIVVAARLEEDAIFAVIRAGAHDYIQKHDLGLVAPAIERALRDAAVHASLQRDAAALREELREKVEIIHSQRAAIRVLSTPIIEVWDGVLMTPVLGVLDEERAAAMMDSLLAAVVRSRCRHVILDLTGVESMDAGTAGHVKGLVAAVELLGAQGIVVGIRPRVAQTIVAEGIDLSRIVTLATLRAALLRCMKRAAPVAG